MSRVTKYRAWDKVNKRMIHFGKFCWHDEYDLCYMEGSLDVPAEDNLDFMQFTGAHDKNGKEIFELDIVKWSKRVFNFDATDDRDEIKMKDIISFIEYVGHGFWVHDENFGWEGENLWDWDEMEVIGNVYENSELLKK